MNLHDSKNQRLTPIKSMIFGTCFIIAFDVVFKLSLRLISLSILDYDAFFLGRYIGASHFGLTYLCILTRVLFKDSKVMNTLFLISTSTLILLGLGGVIFTASIYNQELIQIMGLEFSGFQFRQTVMGVASIIPTISFIMIITPVIIPSTQLHLIGQLFNNKASTGHSQMDQFLEAKKKRNIRPMELQTGPEVLIVEDDIDSATLVMKFCKNLKLDCRHFESIQQGMECFGEFEKHWKVLILDNFVRVDDDTEGMPKTGAEWAKDLNQMYPKGKRHFQIALLTGHSHLVEDLDHAVDYILQKPWNPRDLFHFLKEKEVI